MMRKLPGEMSKVFTLFRGELQDAAVLASRPRPLSPSVVRQVISDLISSFNRLESDTIKALEDDPDYRPESWAPDDLVTLTDWRPL